MSRKYKILSITLKKEKKKKRYIVTLSNNNAFEVSEDVLIDKSLYINKEIYKTDLDKILLRESFSNVREAALVLLNYRMRSKKELALRLHRKGFTTIQIESTIVELEEKGLIDDEKFGLFFARDNVKRSLLGPVALKHRLKSHFLSFEIIEKICDNIYQEFPIESLIRDIINKHSLNDLKNHSKNKKRLISKLKRKGYCWNDIEPVLKYYNI